MFEVYTVFVRGSVQQPVPLQQHSPIDPEAARTFQIHNDRFKFRARGGGRERMFSYMCVWALLSVWASLG